MTFIVTTAASSYKLTTVADLKALMKITSSTDDTLMSSCIDRASAQIVAFCNRGFAKETLTETVKSNGGINLVVKRTPIVSITSITLAGTLVDASAYSLDEPAAGFIYNENGWNCTYGKNSYSIVYVAGYVLPSFITGTINLPEEVSAACLELAKSLYLGGARDPNITRDSVPDVRDVTYGGSSSSVAGGSSASAILNALAPLQRYKRFSL